MDRKLLIQLIDIFGLFCLLLITADSVLATEKVNFSGKILAGNSFKYTFGDGFIFRLELDEYGWEIVIQFGKSDENISRLTPPLHFFPNPRQIWGWHLRNADNTSTNEVGQKNINVYGMVREFIFSPEVGRSIQGVKANRQVTPEEIEKIQNSGSGSLRILDYQLKNGEPGQKAKFSWMYFDVELFWKPCPTIISNEPGLMNR